jgi:E3 ubiquitin-protein ligase HUWE1
MYDDEYGDEMEYGEDEISADGEENVSDVDEELGEMGEIEGLHGDPGVVEVIMGDDDDDDDVSDDDNDDELSDEEDDDDDDSNGMEDLEEGVEILDEEGNPLDDDGNSGWESESDDEEEDDDDLDYEAEAQNLDEARLHAMEPRALLDNLARAVMRADDDFEPEDLDPNLRDHYIEEDHEEDGELPSRKKVNASILLTYCL